MSETSYVVTETARTAANTAIAEGILLKLKNAGIEWTRDSLKDALGNLGVHYTGDQMKELIEDLTKREIIQEVKE